MDLKAEAMRQGLIKPEQVMLLRRVLAITLPEGASSVEREFHARTLVNLFVAGMRNEDELLAAFDHLASAKAA